MKSSEEISNVVEQEIQRRSSDTNKEERKYDAEEIYKVLVSTIEENISIRQENEQLLEYKQRYEQFQDLSYIFEDEKFMEDWLERNIHKVIKPVRFFQNQEQS